MDSGTKSQVAFCKTASGTGESSLLKSHLTSRMKKGRQLSLEARTQIKETGEDVVVPTGERGIIQRQQLRIGVDLHQILGLVNQVEEAGEVEVKIEAGDEDGEEGEAEGEGIRKIEDMRVGRRISPLGNLCRWEHPSPN